MKFERKPYQLPRGVSKITGQTDNKKDRKKK